MSPMFRSLVDCSDTSKETAKRENSSVKHNFITRITYFWLFLAFLKTVSIAVLSSLHPRKKIVDIVENLSEFSSTHIHSG